MTTPPASQPHVLVIDSCIYICYGGIHFFLRTYDKTADGQPISGLVRTVSKRDAKTIDWFPRDVAQLQLDTMFLVAGADLPPKEKFQILNPEQARAIVETLPET